MVMDDYRFVVAGRKSGAFPQDKPLAGNIIP
jgi:hypothetical protein